MVNSQWKLVVFLLAVILSPILQAQITERRFGNNVLRERNGYADLYENGRKVASGGYVLVDRFNRQARDYEKSTRTDRWNRLQQRNQDARHYSKGYSSYVPR